ncbi:diguanylate cyclase [Novosphingobium pentaromativorans US6-1]|uniref:diguanylate cyclase n=1 Tax=Novosphingobium pentaromativorans US6-1 TaxID=1088721 RepID=G6ECA7_9SPHN|nr:diguanylate cyclase [Novosphingobium pentaromativorans US6-1]EHJ61042.1 diguanylate cyclase [Novosphingobium pentaromativorans US6-1]
MIRSRWKLLLSLLLLAWAGLASAAPVGHEFPIGSTCFASGTLQTSYREIAQDRSRWTCQPGGASIVGQRSFVRFDMHGRKAIENPVLTTRLTLFSAMRVTAIGTSGEIRSLAFGRDDMAFATDDWLMRVALPRLSQPVASYVAEFDLPRHVGVLTAASVGPAPRAMDVGRSELVIAWLCGLLCVPLVLNFAFFRVLRQRFVLWHAAAVLFMLIQTVVSSGLINRFVSLSMMELSVLSAGSWGMAITTASLFISDLIEPGKLDRIQVTMLRWLGPWVIAWSYIYLFAADPIRPLSAQGYLASYVPVILVFAWAFMTAASRGSRAILFQIVAWAPMMLTGALRILSALGLFEVPIELMLEQHISIGFEVVVTSIGVADRFMAIKRQRDHALAHTKILEGLAARDPLTGLYNRRGIEERFDDLTEEGFATMALLDLDHFKVINDTMGHATGDAVLQAVAVALGADEDTLAVRIGGEEFLLLLRGKDGPERAERRRKSIPARIAAEIPGLDRLVTASMGMVTCTSPVRFSELYSRCDHLLYEAKAAGRNRTEREVLTPQPLRETGATVVNLR